MSPGTALAASNRHGRRPWQGALRRRPYGFRLGLNHAAHRHARFGRSGVRGLLPIRKPQRTRFFLWPANLP